MYTTLSKFLLNNVLINLEFLLNKKKKNLGGVADIEEAVLCTLTMQGAYPTLLITDVQGQGSANLMSKIKLWNMLSIDK